MKKAVTTVHTILVVAILIATAGWSAYYLYNQRKINSEIFSGKIPVLAKEVSESFIENDALYNNDFSDKIKALFGENSDLTALTIYSYDTGIEYFYSRNNQIKIKSASDRNPDDNPMPEYSGVGLIHRNRIGTIPLNLPGKPGSHIDCVFTVLPQGTVFFVLRISLIVVIVLFSLTLLLILIFSMSSARKAPIVEEDNWTPQADQLEESSDEPFSPANEDGEMSFDTQESLDDFSFPEGDDSLSTENSDDFDDGFLGDDSLSSALGEDPGDNLDFPEDEPLEFDDLNLEDSIPDIPEDEDLLAMNHEEASVPAGNDLDDFDLPADDEGFDDIDISEDNSVDEPSLYNPESGLGWEQFLEERLSLELERAASFDQDLVLLMVRNDMIGSDAWEQLTSVLKETYSYSDLVFEAGKNELAIIEPNKDLDESIKDVQSLLMDLDGSVFTEPTIVGLSSRNGRLISGRRLIREAHTSLNKADTENPIVGFRSDPERFREYLEKNQ